MAESIDCKYAWFALRTRSRHESAASMALDSKGYDTLLPLYKARRRWSDRIKQIDLPLFPGYLFCRFDPQYQLPIIKTPGVVSIISFVRMPMPVEKHEIASIQALV